MKKWFAGLLLIVLIAVAATYILIPATLSVSSFVYSRSTLPGSYRTLISNEKWQQWWPVKNGAANNIFEYKGDRYALAKTFPYNAAVTIKHGNENMESYINLIDISHDSILLNWEFKIHTDINPFKRIAQYNEAVTLKKNTKEILDHFKKFIENKDNVYGLPIKMSSIDYISIITTKTTFTHYPLTNEIYNSINFLKQFAGAHTLKEIYVPMINVIKNNDTSYRLMTALPIDKNTNFNGTVHSVEMVKGNYLITQVKGGYQTINHALDQMALYFQDYQKTSMAIPFQYLITNRISEPDTSKWITKIYAPVMF